MSTEQILHPEKYASGEEPVSWEHGAMTTPFGRSMPGYEAATYGDRFVDAPDVAALYERGAGVNYLRVQADNLDQPFDMNRGAKLDLGSTAKLRGARVKVRTTSRCRPRPGRCQA